MEEGKEVAFDPSRPERRIRIGQNLFSKVQKELISTLRSNEDVFTRDYSDMTSINPNIIYHILNVDLNYPTH